MFDSSSIQISYKKMLHLGGNNDSLGCRCTEDVEYFRQSRVENILSDSDSREIHCIPVFQCHGLDANPSAL